MLGDFNGHITLLGPQRQDENGSMVMDFVNNFGLNLLNIDEACQGTYTWNRHQQRSVIDFVLVNNRCYRFFENMHIDETRELLDISDHNMITITFKIPTDGFSFRKGKEVKKTYYKVDEQSLWQFVKEMERRLEMKKIEQFEELNEAVKEVADQTLRATYCRKLNNNKDIKEQPWISPEIREAIKKRKEINRKRRNTQSSIEKERFNQEYIEQKCKVQLLVKDAVTKYEKKITDELWKDKNRSKTIWENIDRLRKKERTSEEDLHLYREDGSPLSGTEEKEELVRYWTIIYQQHTNDVDIEWNVEKQESYIETVTTTQIGLSQES